MDFVLPPPINWNCSRVLDGDGSGILCYASRHGVYLMDLTESINTCPTLVALHHDRVNAVSIRNFVRDGNQSWTLCSGSSGGMVKVTSISHNKNPSLLTEHKKHKSSVLAVHCSTSSENLVASGDEKGCLIVCNYLTNEFIWWNAKHCDGAILSLSFAPESCDTIAVGMKRGLVVMKIENSLVVPLHRLLDHNDEIHNLIWLTPSAEAKPMLVSCSKDKMVIVRDPETFKGQRLMTCDGIPQRFGHKKWFTVCSFAWIGDGFISTGLNGEMFLWSLRGDKPWRLHGGEVKGHSKGIINVTTWLSKQGVKMAMSVSLDRTIVIWNIDEMRACFSIPNICGYVYSISRSPFCPDVFAIGVGDNTIRIFNNYNGSTICSNADIHHFKYKVTSLSWNPENEKMLAIGMEEGILAIVKDVHLKTINNIEYSPILHNACIHSLVWGPAIGNKKGLTLYSVGGMIAYAHNPSSIENVAAIDVQDVIAGLHADHVKSNITELCFSPCNNFIVLGHEDGSMDVHDVGSLWKICCIINCKKMINCIAWHPNSSSNRSNVPQFSNFVAVASNGNDVYVFDLKNVIDEWRTSPSPQTFILNECLLTLRGHQHKVTKVAWSPRQPELLASASSDGTVQIWNVVEGRGVANYRGHHGQVLCVTWGGSGEVLYSGGDDFTLRGWKFAELKDVLPPEDKNYKSKNISALLERNEMSTGSSESIQSGHDDDDDDDDSSSLVAKEDVVIVENGLGCQKDKRLKRKAKSLLPVSSSKENTNKHQNQLECIQLASLLYSGKARDEISLDETAIHMGCFVNRRSADRMIEQEIQHHMRNENHNQQVLLEMFKGVEASYFREMARKNQLNDYIVSMAMSVSPELAEEMHVAYANQLLEDKSFVKASSYLLSAGRTEDAIKLLLNNKMQKEALCLAISRLNSSNPLLHSCYLSAADAYAINGNFEYASKCLLAIGKSREAISMVLRRSEPAALGIASSVAMATGEDKLRLTYMCSYVVEQMLACDWLAAEEFLEPYSDTEHLLLFVTCHKFLSSLLFKFVPEVVTFLRSNPDHINMDASPSMIISPLECCLKKWRNSGILEKLDMADIHKHLLTIHNTRQSVHNFQNLLVDISLQIAIFIAEQLMQVTQDQQIIDESNHWLLDALIKMETNGDIQSKLSFSFSNILFLNGDNNINNHINRLRTLFLKTKHDDYADFKDYFNKDSEEFVAMPTDVESIVLVLEKFSNQLEREDEMKIADCILAKCCSYAINMLIEITQQPSDAVDHSHIFKSCPPEYFNFILKRSSDILLNTKAYGMQKIASGIGEINKLCKEIISEGGCRVPESGDGNKSEVSLLELASQLQAKKDCLATYPKFYEHFPDCERSAQLLIEASKMLNSNYHQEILSVVDNWMSIIN